MNTHDPQSLANSVRELVGDTEPVRRLGIELLRATSSEAGLTVRARHGRQILVAHRGTDWVHSPAESTAREIAGDLVAAALAAPGAAPSVAPPGPPRPARAVGAIRHASTG